METDILFVKNGVKESNRWFGVCQRFKRVVLFVTNHLAKRALPNCW